MEFIKSFKEFIKEELKVRLQIMKRFLIHLFTGTGLCIIIMGFMKLLIYFGLPEQTGYYIATFSIFIIPISLIIWVVKEIKIIIKG